MTEAQVVFNQEVMNKKRIGRNVFSKKGYRSNGMKLGDSYFRLSHEEKMALNGDVATFNLREILPLSEYSRLTQDQQVLYLTYWLQHYTKEQIAEKFASERVIKFEMKRLGLKLELKEAPKKVEKPKMSVDEKKKAKRAEESALQRLIPFSQFKSMPKEEKVKYLRRVSKKVSLVKISKAWGKSTSYASSLLHYHEGNTAKTPIKAVKPKSNETVDPMVEKPKEIVVEEPIVLQPEVNPNKLLFEINQEEISIKEIQQLLSHFDGLLNGRTVKIKLSLEA